MTKFSSKTTVMHHRSRLGPLVLARSAQGLRGVWWAGQRHFPADLPATAAPHDALLQDAAAQLDAYLAGQRQAFALPLDATVGTPFQRAVWATLRGLAYGQTCSYAGLAQALGRPQ